MSSSAHLHPSDIYPQTFQRTNSMCIPPSITINFSLPNFWGHALYTYFAGVNRGWSIVITGVLPRFKNCVASFKAYIPCLTMANEVHLSLKIDNKLVISWSALAVDFVPWKPHQCFFSLVNFVSWIVLECISQDSSTEISFCISIICSFLKISVETKISHLTATAGTMEYLSDVFLLSRWIF